MGICSAVCCSNGTNNGHRLFRFPKDKNKRKAWALRVRRKNWEANENSRLCEIHFEPWCFKNDGNKIILRENAVPTVFAYIPQKKRKTPNSLKIFNCDCNKAACSSESSLRCLKKNFSDHTYAKASLQFKREKLHSVSPVK